MPDLGEQIREFIDAGAQPVTVEDVITGHWGSEDGSLGRSAFRRSRRLRSYAIGAAAMAAAICVLVVVLIVGVLPSSKPSMVSPTRPSSVPASWQRVTFGGLTMYAPGNWPVTSQNAWGDCGTAGQPLFKASSVVLDNGAQGLAYHCPAITATSRIPLMYGLVVDPGRYGPLFGRGSFDKCMSINGLSVCPTSTDYGGIVVLAVHVAGHAQPVAVEIGLAGGGKLAHTIMYSMRATGSKPTASPAAWAEQTIASAVGIQSITPIPEGVYWLSQSDDMSGHGATITVFRYDPSSGQLTNGPSVVGFVGSQALTVTGGWVWLVVGVGDDLHVEQISPLTLVIHATRSLRVSEGYVPANPVLTATADGPLWVAGGDDLWALDPGTGAVETELNTGNEISSMSTDPTGSLLYTGGQMTDSGGPSVTEYDARTGQELKRMSTQSIGPGTVAATAGGVWVSARTGMAGDAVELSATGLKQVAPPASESRGFGTFDQIMGVWSSVSEQTLWLTSTTDLTCADPATGAVRASETTPSTVSAPAASGQKLYAIASANGVIDDVVVITPPAKCFAS